MGDTPNLALWDAVGKTDPKHTKPFKRTGGFQGTALKPMWVWRKLTEQFGACGVGWGCDEPSFQLVPADKEMLVYCTVRAWHGTRENALWGIGGDKAVSTNKYGTSANDEAFKMAFTDALMNAFKYVGVGADIHMGMFDDSKYVERVSQEFAEPENKTEPSPREKLEGKHSSKSALGTALKEYASKVGKAQSVRELDAIDTDYADTLEQGKRYLPKWIDGDGSTENRGIKRIADQMRSMLVLADAMRELDTVKAMTAWMAANEAFVDGLDDQERRKFDKLWEARDAEINTMDRVAA